MKDDGRFYGDATTRYLHDAEFHALVNAITKMGLEFGFTPGELRDAAFVAALKIEQRKPVRPIFLDEPPERE